MDTMGSTLGFARFNANHPCLKDQKTFRNLSAEGHIRQNNPSTASMNEPDRASDGAGTACDVSSAAPELNEDQQEVSRLLRGLRHDPTLLGCFSLGKDGIMRSLTADRDVVDAVPFSSKHIKAFLDRLLYNAKAEEEFRGVDGMQVPYEQWYHPDKSMLPPPLTQEQKEKAMEMMEGEHKELFRVRKEQIVKGEDFATSCPLVVQSNHDLSVKPTEEA